MLKQTAMKLLNTANCEQVEAKGTTQQAPPAWAINWAQQAVLPSCRVGSSHTGEAAWWGRCFLHPPRRATTSDQRREQSRSRGLCRRSHCKHRAPNHRMRRFEQGLPAPAPFPSILFPFTSSQQSFWQDCPRGAWRQKVLLRAGSAGASLDAITRWRVLAGRARARAYEPG
jgi:hypothetical protein